MDEPVNIGVRTVRFTSVNLEVSPDFDSSQLLTPSFKLERTLDATNDRRFHLVLALSLTSEDGGFKLDVKCRTEFQTDRPIAQEFCDGRFMKVNAPAIVYPYVRAFVTMLTANAGLRQVNLPLVNFVRLEDEMKKLSP